MDFVLHPIRWWIEPFTSNDFMVYSLMGGLLVAISTAVIGTWVVLRGMSFFGDALAHAILPGVAIAYIVGFNTTIGASVAALIMAAGISVIRERSPLPDDTSIGILFVGALAFAVVLLSQHSGSYIGDLNRFLFGSITGVTTTDVVGLAISTAVAILIVTLLYRPLLASTFDETQARIMGFRPGLTHWLLMGLVALAVVSSFRVVGNLLVFAFLIAPPAAAALVVRTVPYIMVTASAIGCVSVLIGLLVSYHYNTAASASMALVSVTIFVAILIATSLRSELTRSERSSNATT